jgi:protein-disulfide isomerase
VFKWILPWVAAIATLCGCHKTDGGQASPDAMVGAPPAPPNNGARAEDEYWAHTKVVFDVPVGRAPVLGPEGALVTIVEFSEFSCVPCRTAETILKALRSQYGDKVRLVWKNKPQAFRAASEPAAEGAL